MKEKSEEKITEKLDNLNKSYTRFFPLLTVGWETI